MQYSKIFSVVAIFAAAAMAAPACAPATTLPTTTKPTTDHGSSGLCDQTSAFKNASCCYDSVCSSLGIAAAVCTEFETKKCCKSEAESSTSSTNTNTQGGFVNVGNVGNGNSIADNSFNCMMIV